MTAFRNISPQGALDLPLIGRVVAAGEEFDVTVEDAELLALQPGLWQPVGPAPTVYDKNTVPELKQLLEDRHLDTTGNKPDLIARLVESDQVADTQGAGE